MGSWTRDYWQNAEPTDLAPSVKYGDLLSHFRAPIELQSQAITLDPGPQFAGDDIADNITTTTSITVGGSLSSAIQSNGDLDYIRVTLTAGQTYTFSLDGSSLSDAYVELRDSTGALVAQNDDGGIAFDSFLMYRATTSGTFYIVARHYSPVVTPDYPSVTGDYTLSVNTVTQGETSPTAFPGNSLPHFSWDEAAIQISRNGYSWAQTFGASAVVTYSYRSSAPAQMPDDTAGFSRFSAGQIAAAEAALAAWAAVANITFVRVNDGDGYSNNAAIVFGNYSTGSAGAAAFAFNPSTGDQSISSVQGDVWINSSLSYNATPVVGAYGQQVLLHEIGHALGLSHPGDYNAGNGGSITYGANAVYYSDSRMFTAMSYFEGGNTGANTSQYASLPELHDIAAIQRLYGANVTTRTGDTIYGFNSNTGVPEYTLTLTGQAAIFAVWDNGGIDTFDFSGYSTNNTIDLRAEAFSSVGPSSPNSVGLAIFNISIARGVVIENAIGGTGDDTIIGNSADNTLNGAFGTDTLNGNGGNDRLIGGTGNDLIAGGDGIDTSVYTVASTSGSWVRDPSGSWTVTGNGFDTVSGVEVLQFTDRNVVLDNAFRTFTGDGTSDLLWRNANTGAVAVWQMSGAVQSNAYIAGGAPGEWSILGTGDFSGDGRDDIVWRNTTTTAVAVWANGSGTAASIITGVPGNWQFQGVGDFNFDGRDDFVWRNANDGAVAVWLMNGNTISNQAIVSAAPAAWAIAGIADFDGDGRDDILLRNTDGTVARWTTDGVTQTGAAIIGSAPTNWQIQGVGDFNGDGRADILFRNTNDGGLAMWQMNGNATLGMQMVGGAPLSWTIANIGDYNGDGRDDILWHNTDGTVALWTMNGFTVQNQAIVANVPTEWGLI